MRPEPFFILDGPCYHQVRPGGQETFRGMVLSLDQDRVAEVVATSGGSTIGRARPDGPSPELGMIPLAGSAACRFALSVPVARGAEIRFWVRFESGREIPVFRYDVPFVEREAARLRVLEARIAALPVPDTELIASTQGLGDVEAYRASTVGAFLTMESLLRAAGVDPSHVRSVLDIGCGTGRLLVGWHADDPGRHLVGTDLNGSLIAWARTHLDTVASWEVNRLHPPLAYAPGAFDLVVLASVLTHLSLKNQKAWLAEARRVLAPEGHALVTLHGPTYAAVLLRDPASATRYAETGYAEIAVGAEGGNSYTTFHAEPFARRLFAGFSRLAFFPRGVSGDVAHELPVASLQDVYILAR